MTQPGPLANTLTAWLKGRLVHIKTGQTTEGLFLTVLEMKEIIFMYKTNHYIHSNIMRTSVIYI